MKNRSVICRILAAVCFAVFFSPVERGMAEEGKVIFECEDIGVEARRLLENLREERQRFVEREENINKREAELKILKAEADEKLKRLEEAGRKLKELLSRKEEEESDMIRGLARIYQRRDPAGAAVTLSEMDKDLAVAVLSAMRDKFAGEILDAMENETAVVYSTALGRLGR